MEITQDIEFQLTREVARSFEREIGPALRYYVYNFLIDLFEIRKQRVKRA